MQDSPDKHTLPRKRRRRNGLLPFLLVPAAIGACVVMYFQLFRPATEPQLEVGSVRVGEKQSGSSTAIGDQTASYNLALNQSPTDTRADGTAADSVSDTDQSAVSPSNTATEQTTTAGQGLAPPDNHTARQRLEQFYSQLDTRPFILEARLGTSSREYFARLAQKLLDTPPLVSGETDDLFNVLRNTSHFFRIAGKGNIILLKKILASEYQLQEQLFADCYHLVQEPEQMQLATGISIREEALYEYAGFFLKTMGGRLYLYRRDPGLRMLVSYYCILLVDRANTDGRNRHGIDLGPPVAQLIDEMETGGGELLGRDHYLDTLYRLQGKYPPGQ